MSPCLAQRSTARPTARLEPETAVKKNADLSHRNRTKTKRYRAKLKAKQQRARKRNSSGQRKTYR